MRSPDLRSADRRHLIQRRGIQRKYEKEMQFVCAETANSI